MSIQQVRGSVRETADLSPAQAAAVTKALPKLKSAFSFDANKAFTAQATSSIRGMFQKPVW